MRPSTALCVVFISSVLLAGCSTTSKPGTGSPGMPLIPTIPVTPQPPDPPKPPQPPVDPDTPLPPEEDPDNPLPPVAGTYQAGLFVKGVESGQGATVFASSAVTPGISRTTKDGKDYLTVAPVGAYSGGPRREISDTGSMERVSPSAYTNPERSSEARTYQEGDFFFVETAVFNNSARDVTEGNVGVEIGASYAASNVAETDVLRAKRSATYTGDGSIRINGDNLMTPGRATLSADFDNGVVSGEITAVRNGQNISVDLREGTISGSNFSGQTVLRADDPSLYVEGRSGNYLGTFTGADGSYAGGVFAGHGVNPSGPVIYRGQFLVNEK